MPDYYIRTPEQDESRGPFDITKLRTLAEAGQVHENTLYYDEDKEEWMPIALNEFLMMEVFPKREKLNLDIKMREESTESPHSREKESEINVEDLLKAAEADTEETRHLKRNRKSFERSVAVASMTLGFIMILSAVSFIVPHMAVIQAAGGEKFYTNLLNYPFLLVGVFDLIMSVLVMLAVTEIYPLLRGRSMLGLGFGLYVGWALGDPMIMLGFGLGGLGVFMITVSQKFSITVAAIAMGILGNGLLLYLATEGRLDDFYGTFQLTLFSQ